MQRRHFIYGAVLAGAALARSEASAAQSIVDRFAAALNAHDIVAFADLFAEDYANHQSSAAAPAPSGKSAKRATVDFFQARLEAMSDLAVSVEVSLIEGERAAASFLYEGTQTGVYYGFAPSGRKLRFTSCDIFRVRDGRIVEHWGMGDIAGVLKQLKA